MTLRELTGQYSVLFEMAEEGNIDPQVMKDTLESVDYEFEQKAEAYAAIMDTLAGQVDTIDKEIARLTEMKRTKKNNIDYMKKALQRAMITADKKKFKTDFHSFSIRKNALSLDNVDSLAVPEEFLVISKTVDRVALLKAVKEDPEKFVGIASLKQTESLVIK